ncbi:MAG: methyltransferase domain-containing protein [Melioribacteraceae bacterium]|nr:methyltransferase domain-containing protein [Melioribacteraceae bacterium]
MDAIEEKFYFDEHIKNDIHIILDLGGGSGRMASRFALIGKEVTIVENDDTAIEAGLLKCKLNYIKMDIINYLKNAPGDTYDLVIANQVLSYFDSDQIATIIKEVARVLRKDKYFSFSFINERSYKKLVKNIIGKKQGISEKSLSLTVLRKIIKEYFQIDKMLGYNNIPFKRSSNSLLVKYFAFFEKYIFYFYNPYSHWFLITLRKKSYDLV